MNQDEALGYLAKLYADKGLEGLQKFAATRGLSWATVYGWYRRKSVPAWRLSLFRKASAAQTRKQAST